MTQLLQLLNLEVELLNSVGEKSFCALFAESESLLQELHDVERELEAEIATGLESGTSFETVDKAALRWYKQSISHLKTYNGQLTRFQKNLVNNSSKFNINLDDAYTFPLMLNAYPVKEDSTLDRSQGALSPQSLVMAQNRDQLMRSIVLHLLKVGQGSVVKDLLPEFGILGLIDEHILEQFARLNSIVDDVKTKHSLTKALDWLKSRQSQPDSRYDKILFKFHMLQFVLLLAGDSSQPSPYNFESALAAYTYAKSNFPDFIKEYVSEISPIITLLLFKTTADEEESHLTLLKKKIHQAFVDSCESGRRFNKETHFIAEVLENFDVIHSNESLFGSLANEFVSEFCADMSLSSESSLFQTMLAGFVNLPNFYKYSKLQEKLMKKSEEQLAPRQDLPFQLPDKNQFLFKYHPIFICPVSKEQLVPLVSVVKYNEGDLRDRKRKQIFVSEDEVLVSPTNPVVVFEHCRHLALKDSVRVLTKMGTEMFKCHYCYKKHKLLDVSDAYFIDL